MSELILLVHRIPYPPDKGDKIRSFHLLKHLSERHRVHLGAFVDDPGDWQYEAALKPLCASVHLEAIHTSIAKWRSLGGLLTGKALTLEYFRNQGMTDWVEALLKTGLKRVIAFSSPMAQFVMKAKQVQRIMDFVDIDSDKWGQFAPTKPWPLSWLYKRESKSLLAWERRVAANFDCSLFVSAREASDFCKVAPGVSNRVHWYPNGVDSDYFSPARIYPYPYAANEEAIVFTGAMDYWPNIDGVTWFARNVFPAIRKARPKATFYVVGSRPTKAVQALRLLDGIHVTGRVQDVRPYLAHASVVVAPLRIARGVQNKVLEGMAMARTVVVSTKGLDGLMVQPSTELLVADDEEQFVARTLDVLNGVDLGSAARQRILTDYVWEACFGAMDALLERGPT